MSGSGGRRCWRRWTASRRPEGRTPLPDAGPGRTRSPTRRRRRIIAGRIEAGAGRCGDQSSLAVEQAARESMRRATPPRPRSTLDGRRGSRPGDYVTRAEMSTRTGPRRQHPAARERHMVGARPFSRGANTSELHTVDAPVRSQDSQGSSTRRRSTAWQGSRGAPRCRDLLEKRNPVAGISSGFRGDRAVVIVDVRLAGAASSRPSRPTSSTTCAPRPAGATSTG